MNVVIDGVVYVPKHSASGQGGKVKSLSAMMMDGRDHKGWTMAEAARRSGLKINHVARAECGSMTFDSAVALADAYGIPLEQLARAVRRTRA